MNFIFGSICLSWLAVASVSANPAVQPRILKTTAERIASYGYPVEEHTVQTSDGYILKLFRIPYSPKLQNQDDETKPVIFLQHGLILSSDNWILNGPENALAYVLVDAGYDVWMGNARGNVYSRKHVFKLPFLPSFWDFSWHEIGKIDLPAMIDYVLSTTGHAALHYVGHSQGSTGFFVMLSLMPDYNAKIKTSHMLAPVAYMEHMQTPIAKVLGPLLGNPSLLTPLIGSSEFLPSNDLISMLGSAACKEEVVFQPMCGNILMLMGGWGSKRLNYTLMPDVMEIYPAGSSSSQLIHYLQEQQSGLFRQYDFGSLKNFFVYGSTYPPNYLVSNIHPATPMHFYYSDNDYWASVVDVERLAHELGDNVEMHHVQYSDWNHFDFLFATEVKEVINDHIVRLANEYEDEE